MTTIKRTILTILPLLFILIPFRSAAQDGQPVLSNEELSWIQENPVIRVHNEMNWAPFNFNRGGRPQGFSVEYMELVARTVGLRIEWISGPTWDDFLDMMKTGELDVMLNTAYTEERDSYMNFTEPYLKFAPSIYIRDDEPMISSIEEIYGKKFAIQKGFYYEALLENYDEIELVPVAGTEEAIIAVSTGSADLLLDLIPIVNYLSENLFVNNLKPGGTLGIDENALVEAHFAVREDLPLLLSILSKGMRTITEDELSVMRKKWLGYNEQTVRIEFSSEELIFMKEHPIIRVHNEQDWPPFNFNRNGLPSGLSIDYMNLLAEKAGLNIKYIAGPSWSEFLEKTRKGEHDVILNVVQTEKRKKYLLFTDYYIKNPNVIVSRDKSPYAGLSELEGKTVAVVKDYFHQEILETSYPEINLLHADSVLECLKAVSLDRADATIVEEAVGRYIAKENFLTGLRISGEVEIGSEEITKLRIGVRSDWPELRSILQKAMDEVSPGEMQEITELWIEKTESVQTTDTETADPLIETRYIHIFIVLIVTLTVAFTAQYLFRKKSARAEGFNIRRIRTISLAVLSMSIIITLTFSLSSLLRGKKETLSAVEKNLQVVNTTTHEALKIWIDRNLKQLDLEARDPMLVRLVEALTSLPHTKEALLDSSELAALRYYFAEVNPYSFSEGFFIITGDRISVASRRDENIGNINLIEKSRPGLLQQAFNGRATFIPPVHSDVHNTGDNPTGHGSIFYAVPIRNSAGEIIAVLTQREDPEKEFTRFCNMGRIGNSGETYAFDGDALMLTNSRFDKELISSGLLGQGEASSLHTYVLDPGTDILKGKGNVLPLAERRPTYMIQHALSGGGPGTNISGYRDYRGVEVFGAWKWSDELGFGLATEIDKDDALSSFSETRMLVLIVIVVVFLLTGASTVFSIAIGEKANRSLQTSNDRLENRVLDRTRELTEAKKNLENSLEALTHPFYVIDADTYKIVLSNSAAERAAGGAELSTCYRLTHRSEKPCDSKEHPCPLAMVKKTGKPFSVEHIHFDENSKPVFAEVHGYPIFDDQGKVVQMIEYSLDITTKKKAEEAIKKSEERFKLSTENAGIATWEYMVEEDRMYGSPLHTEFLGFDPQTSDVYERWAAGLHPDDRERAVRDWTAHLAGRTETYLTEFRYRKSEKDDYRWIFGAGKVTERKQDGSPKLMLGINQDITDRKTAEEEIRQSEEMFKVATENAGIAAWEWYSDGDTIECSPLYTEIFGIESKTYNVSELINSRIHPDDRATAEAAWDRMYRGTEELYRVEFRYKKPTAEDYIWLFEAGKILDTDENGNVVSVIGINQDITDRKKNEIELAQAKEDAEAATRAKSDFLANMSHEIRTPMNAIIGLSHLIQKTKLSAKQKDYISKIYGSAHNLLGIINDILDFSKIEAGKLTMESIDFDINEVFDNLGAMVSEKAHNKNLELVFHVSTDIPPRLVGDPLRLGQILLNLTNNAIKFTEDGEIAVMAELIDKTDEEVIISFLVRDTGIGLTKDQSTKLFRAFSQADTSTTRKYGGTGLGLSISKRLAEMMGGAIGVESAYGEGSTFYFTGRFKFSEQKKREVVPAEIKNLNVLVVDDNDASREVIAEYVRSFSFRATAVDNGHEAIQLIRKNLTEKRENFKLILMDYSMPGLNGFQTAHKISELLNPEDRPKYILVTGFGRDEILQGIEKNNFEGFVLKPVNQSLLFNTIMQAFGHERESSQTAALPNRPDGFERIRGAKVLLVEDNEINQQVASEVIEAEGFYVDIAPDGKKAVDAVQTSDYDIVLMDLQMPVMDGFKATKTIRTLTGFESLPIVAMTADAMSGVREEVIKAGMNDYVTKPIDPAELWESMVKWVPQKQRQLPDGFVINDTESENTDIPDIQGIDTGDGLKRIGGNLKLYRNLLKKFTTDFENFADNIAGAVTGGETDRAVREAHTLKGVSGNIGAEELMMEAEKLELLLKDKKDEKEQLASVSAMLKSITAEVADSGVLDENESREAGSEISAENFQNKLSEAVESLKKRKPKPALDILDEMLKFKLDSDTSDTIEEATALLGRYKMKEAAALLEKVMDAAEKTAL